MAYQYLIVAFSTLILTQILKFTIESVKEKRLNWGRLFNGSGGMPSSHSSFAFSLVFMLGYGEGFSSPIFAVALVFGLIVAYDAMGLRLESGRQAAAINIIVRELLQGKDVNIKELKEKIGHYPKEVFWGIVFGLLTSTFFYFLVF